MYIVSLFIAVLRILVIASDTVIEGLRETYSVVMIEPAEFSGYCRISLISFLIWGSACERILLTTFAGISSTRSAASST